MSTWDNLEMEKVIIRQDILSQSGDKAAMTFGTLWALTLVREANPVQIGLKDLSRLSQVSKPTLVKCIDKLFDAGQILDVVQKRKPGAKTYGDNFYELQRPPWGVTLLMELRYLDHLKLGELITWRMFENVERLKKREVRASNATLAEWRGVSIATIKNHRQALISKGYGHYNGNFNGAIGCFNTDDPLPSMEDPVPNDKPKRQRIPTLLHEYKRVVGCYWIQFTPKQIERAVELERMLGRGSASEYAELVIVGYAWLVTKKNWDRLPINIFLGESAETLYLTKWRFGDIKP